MEISNIGFDFIMSYSNVKKLKDRITTVFSSLTFPAKFPHPNLIELLHYPGHQLRFAAYDTRFKISCVCSFDAKTRAGQIGRTGIDQLSVNDDMFKMHPGAQLPFQAIQKSRIFIESSF